MADIDPIQLEPEGHFAPQHDDRPRTEEPLPVRLVAVEDVHLRAVAGLEGQLDDFYAELLRFEKGQAPAEGRLLYHADNVDLVFEIIESPIHRETFRAVRIMVQMLADLEQRLIEREIEYTRQRGLHPGQESLLLLDPAGNWVELMEAREIR